MYVSCIFCLVFTDISVYPVKAWDTVATLTPASLATSRMVTAISSPPVIFFFWMIRCLPLFWNPESCSSAPADRSFHPSPVRRNLRHTFYVAADPVPVIDHNLHPLIRKNEPLGSGIVRVRHLGDISSPDEAAGCMVCRLSPDTQVITGLGDGSGMAPFSYGGQKPHIRAV